MVSGCGCARVRAVRSCLHGAARAAQSFRPDPRVLRRAERMRRSRDFRETVSSGNRAGRPRLVVHVASDSDLDSSAPNVGFVVSAGVGGSVVRHRVTRQLRHLMRPRMESLPRGTRIVIRALPAAATATSAQLDVDISKALLRLGITEGAAHV